MEKYNGIDLSIYQTGRARIDFAAARDSGVRFCMVRAGWCGPQGEMHYDSFLGRTLIDAQAAGVDAGLYVYSYARSREAAVRAARETAAVAAHYTLTYPIAIDVEDLSLSKSLSQGEITATVDAFCAEIRRQGYYPMFYTYLNFARQFLELPALDGYDFWIAEYAPSVSFDGAYTMWQYTGSGECPGVIGPVDRDVGYRDYPTLIRAAGLNHLDEAAPQPEPGSPDQPDAPSAQPEPSSGIALAWLYRFILRLGISVEQFFERLFR